jgi:4-hydroxy-2-oxoheptanedioate aldolase
MFRHNVLKDRMGAGEPVFGLAHALANPSVAEMIGMAGFDFVLIDGEHGTGDHQTHLRCLQAVAGTSAQALLRVDSNDSVVIKRALDLGVDGIMVPNVATAEEARAVVASCRYPPSGIRGYAASGVRASDYGFQAARYLKDYAAELLIAVMIESREGAANVKSIAAVEGIDVIQVGANDLSYDLGVPEQFDHPSLLTAVAHIEDAAKRNDKWLGGAPLPGVDPAGLIERGYRLITLGRDVGVLMKGLSAALQWQKIDSAK